MNFYKIYKNKRKKAGLHTFSQKNNLHTQKIDLGKY